VLLNGLGHLLRSVGAGNVVSALPLLKNLLLGWLRSFDRSWRIVVLASYICIIAMLRRSLALRHLAIGCNECACPRLC